MNEINLRAEDGMPIPPVSIRVGRDINKAVIYSAALTIITGATSLVLISPLLIRQLGHFKGIDWTRLSNVGQTYGAASAVLSAIALLGVSLTLLVQARQARVERIRIVRERHIELLQIILEDPNVYYPVTGAANLSTIGLRRHIFANMWIHYARVGFTMGVLSEEDIRQDILQPGFKGAPMREWWDGAREYMEGRTIKNRAERRFIRILDEEYRKAISAEPSIVLDSERAFQKVAMPKSTITMRNDILKGAALGVAIGIALGAHRRHKRY